MATMLDCKKVQPQISEFIDGGMDGDTAWGIKLHLATCAVCSQVAEELIQTANLLRALPRQETSAGFEAALARRLADQVLEPRRPTVIERFNEWWAQPRLRPAFASAAALAAVIPVALALTYRSGETNALRPATPAPSAAAAATTDPSMDEMWNEHLSYASSEPLADSGGILQAQANPGAAPSAGRTL